MDLVKYLLAEGAHDPNYRTYPFRESLLTIAQDREYIEITELLQQYYRDPAACKYGKDNGTIDFNRTELQQQFEKAVNDNDMAAVAEILAHHPEFARDETYFWGEGILTMPAKKDHRELIELLMQYGATVPRILKWAQFYYFEKYPNAAFMMEKGMNANTMSWHHVTLLHDMAGKGDLDKAALLIKYGADVNPLEEEYQSTPLGLAAKGGHEQMVEYLLSIGADPRKSGAQWATPLAWARKKGHIKVEALLQSAVN